MLEWIDDVMLLAVDEARMLGEASTLLRPTEIEFFVLVEPPGEGIDLVILCLRHK